ncbi:MAG: 23S rRNA pseudouridine(1911/1915/1917) synthase RluD [Gammaproteobacteria bacterium]|nr:23S rRNA pseudouridine(1911/1915/1917) synthase RluD [Gammaproteobacteria bacterium]
MTTINVEKSASVYMPSKGMRLDQICAQLFNDYSRSRLQAWIAQGQLTLNGEQASQRDLVKHQDALVLNANLVLDPGVRAEDIALDIVYEDDALIVVNKPAGLVVHPGAGNTSGTLVNALLHYAPELDALPRAGLVHRIDKDTTGLLVVARTLESHSYLVEALQAREINREYEAVVRGQLVAGGTIDKPIERDPRDRTKMAIRQGGRESVTHYRVLERFKSHTRLRLKLETGRTHQIRIHMASEKHPLVGDPVYGGRLAIPAGTSASLEQMLRGFNRQALHARRLGLIHPVSGERMDWQVAPPEDMQRLVASLREDMSAE